MHSNSWDFLAAFLGHFSAPVASWGVFLGTRGCLATHTLSFPDSPCWRQQQKPPSNFKCLPKCTSTGSWGELCKWGTGNGVTKATWKWCFQQSFRPMYDPVAAPEGWNKLHSIQVSIGSFIIAAIQKAYCLPEMVFVDTVCTTKKYQRLFIKNFLTS